MCVVFFQMAVTSHTMNCVLSFNICLSPLAAPDIGPLLGGRIRDALDKEVHPALDAVLKMTGGAY